MLVMDEAQALAHAAQLFLVLLESDLDGGHYDEAVHALACAAPAEVRATLPRFDEAKAWLDGHEQHVEREALDEFVIPEWGPEALAGIVIDYFDNFAAFPADPDDLDDLECALALSRLVSHETAADLLDMLERQLDAMDHADHTAEFGDAWATTTP